MALQLRAMGEGLGAQRAGDALLVLLVAILDVLLQRRQALVAPVAVRAGQELGEIVWGARWQVCTGKGWEVSRGAGVGGQPNGA